MFLKKYYQFIKGLGHSCKDVAREIAYSQERTFSPYELRNDDVYIVSFPKSGATWMDFLIANINIAMSGDKRSVTFFNVHQYVPDIHDSRALGSPLLPFPGFRFIKSHSQLNRYYNNAIYIVRDPRDTMLSYFHFLRGLGTFDGSISDLIRSDKYGVRSWVQHVQGWFMDSPPALNFLMVRYEDLKSDPVKQLKNIYYHLGFDIPDEILTNAIQLSSFQNMKRLEDELQYGGRPIKDKFNFMRSGNAGEGKLALSDVENELIILQAEPLMRRLNYV